MASYTCPGTRLAHVVISEDCRKNRGHAGAFEEAMRQIREVYDTIHPTFKANLVLTFERPSPHRE